MNNVLPRYKLVRNIVRTLFVPCLYPVYTLFRTKLLEVKEGLKNKTAYWRKPYALPADAGIMELNGVQCFIGNSDKRRVDLLSPIGHSLRITQTQIRLSVKMVD